MAGYPPQQHYAAVHQPAHERFVVPNYHMQQQAYPSLAPNAEHPYQYHPPPPPSSHSQAPPRSPQMQSQSIPGSNSSNNLTQSSQQQQHNMHQTHTAAAERASLYDTHRPQSARPPSQASSQVQQAGPSISRQQQYASNTSSSQHSSQVNHHHSNSGGAVGHHHSLPAPVSHPQRDNHSHSHDPHSHVGYGVHMHPHEYDQHHAAPVPTHHSGGPRMMNQPMQLSGTNGIGNNSKRSNGAVRDKDSGAPVRGGGGGGATKAGGAGAKRSGQEKQSSAGGKQIGASTAANTDKVNANMLATEEPLLESKKIRKRKEVVDRIHRVHWDTLENREILYHDMQHKLAAASTTLLLWPSNSRPYLMAMQRLNLEKDSQLRQSALLHAHQVDSARMAYDQETQKVEDEARNSKKLVREKLLAAVEDRRRRLREDKESGEGMSDTLLDSSTRPHATRKLRNKITSSSKRGIDGDATLAARVAGTTGNNGAMGSNGSLLGLILSGVNGAGIDGTSTPKSGDAHNLLGGLTSMAELNQLSGIQGPISALPPSNFDSATNNTISLLQLQGVGGGMGDSSYMSGTRIALQNQAKGKKKPVGRGSLVITGTTSGGAGNSVSGVANGSGFNASGADDDEDRNNSSNPRTVAAAAAAAAAAASLAIGTGRLRWEPGKSVGQLSCAKDFEIESDLIQIRKAGKRRRR